MFKKYSILRKLKKQQTMSAAIFWSECATQVLSYICAVIVMIMILSVTLQVSTELLTQIVNYTAIVMAVLWCIPIARNTRMRFRDAGISPKAYFWLLLPVIGWVIFIVLLCFKSLPKTPESAVY